MNYNLLFNNNLTDYGILIGCGLILGCSLFYLIKSNYIPIPSKNMEALTNIEIDAIVNENAATIINSENLIDSDSDTEVASDYQSTSDNDSILEVDCDDLDLFFMPNVDFDVCPIQELKFFEISSIFYREIAENSITDDQLMEIINSFTETELLTNAINDFILLCISTM
jgi:hypothetical protein